MPVRDQHSVANPDNRTEKTAIPEVPLHLRLSLTLLEAAAVTGLKVYQLRAAIWAGELAFIQNGTRGQYVVRREALDKFLREQERREKR